MNGYATEKGKAYHDEFSKLLNSDENQQSTRPSLPEIYKIATTLVDVSEKLSDESERILSTLIGKKIPVPTEKQGLIENDEAGALGLITFALLRVDEQMNRISNHLSEIKKVVG